MVRVAIIRPDEQHETRRPPERDDEGAEDGQSHEVGEDPATAAATWTLARLGCQVDWSTFSHTPAVAKHLHTKHLSLSFPARACDWLPNKILLLCNIGLSPL